MDENRLYMYKHLINMQAVFKVPLAQNIFLTISNVGIFSSNFAKTKIHLA